MAKEIQLSKAGAQALDNIWNADVGGKTSAKAKPKTKPDSKATARKKKASK